MSYHKRYKELKKAMGYTNKDVADITGNTPESIKSVTQPNKEIPRWLKLAIVVYERMSDKPFLMLKDWFVFSIQEGDGIGLAECPNCGDTVVWNGDCVKCDAVFEFKE